MFSVEICVLQKKRICQETGKKKMREKQIGAGIRETGLPHFQSQRPSVQCGRVGSMDFHLGDFSSCYIKGIK
jgi:hypothetical protein